MNEDKTQEIYFAMIDAGIKEKDAAILCHESFPKRIYEREVQRAAEYLKQNLKMQFEYFAKILGQSPWTN